MSQPSTGAYWLFTPITAFGATLAAVVVLFYGEGWLLDALIGTERLCGQVECGLGLGVWLLVAGFFTLVASFLAGLVLGAARQRDTPRIGVAALRGLFVAAWCGVAYLLVSGGIWWAL